MSDRNWESGWEGGIARVVLLEVMCEGTYDMYDPGQLGIVLERFALPLVLPFSADHPLTMDLY
jgi:hypothetical protein